MAGAGVGDRLTIRAVNGDQATVQQLQRLGLKPGELITVLNCAESGSVIVAGPQGNVGLGAAIARQVLVTPIKVTPPQAAQPVPMASLSILPVSILPTL
ncbi:MAG: ferrous iron transport protein A [Leptolyngbya sp. RL_3_1]|nr:ferrous iron transport protein A [Leptolyngbya sp. RL_3_1]